MDPGAWSWSPEAIVPLLLAAGYLVVARREASAARLVSFVAGCALLGCFLVAAVAARISAGAASRKVERPLVKTQQ